MAFEGKRVGVLMGGLSGEREISFKTGRAVAEALRNRGREVVEIDAGRDLPARLIDEGVEVVFIALHGRYGEDGCVQGLCEIMAIPYTGSGVEASAVAMNKASTKRVLTATGIPTARYMVLKPGDEVPVELAPPLAVKPASEGSALGVSIVKEGDSLEEAVREAASHGGPVMLEEFVEGRELTVGVVDGETLPVIEIRPKSGFYDYRAKYTKGETDFLVPAELTTLESKGVNGAALSAYEAVGCRGAARVDMILKAGTPFVLEVNTIPGLTETSLLPTAAAAAGWDYETLVERMLDGAGLDKF